MPYALTTIEAVERSPHSLQKTLARAAIRLDMPVTQLSQATGATRWTIYRWFRGYDISPAYRQRVTEVALALERSATKEQAWRILRARFCLDA